MARPLRIEYPGAWYHVMNRGLGRQNVFEVDEHREYFLALLGDTYDQYNAEWHTYCLMGNHYHLMVRTPDGNLQRIMRHINGLYTQHYNRSQKRDGPLFRGRYKAILIDAEHHWLQLSRYIHRNPMDAELTQDLDDYPWSSFPAYIGKRQAPFWLTTHYVLRAIGQRNLQKRYAAYVAAGVDENTAQFYSSAPQRSIFGDESFREQVLRGHVNSIDVPELRAERTVPTADAVIAAVCRHFDVDEFAIKHKTRGLGSTSPARAVTMYLCQRIGDMTLSQIAETFDLASYASAGSSIRDLRQRVKEDTRLKNVVDNILLDLTP